MAKTSYKPSIISCSRRTDIPAYYADWLMKRIELGYTHYPNPFSQQPVFASLRPQDVIAMVFWTRNPKPLIKHLDEIDKRYKHYMHLSINGMPKALEANNPSIDSAIESVKILSDRYKTDKYVQWRFDPIVLSSITPPELIIDKFAELANKLSAYVRRCYISFVDLYQKTDRNFKAMENKLNIQFYKPTAEQQIEIANQLQAIAESNNIQLFACAEDSLLKVSGIEKAHCVDLDIIKEITQLELNLKENPSREMCGCYTSRDIGYYDSCPHGCIYCYSNLNPEIAIENTKNYLKHGFKFDNVTYEFTDIMKHDTNRQMEEIQTKLF